MSDPVLDPSEPSEPMDHIGLAEYLTAPTCDTCQSKYLPNPFNYVKHPLVPTGALLYHPVYDCSVVEWDNCSETDCPHTAPYKPN